MMASTFFIAMLLPWISLFNGYMASDQAPHRPRPHIPPPAGRSWPASGVNATDEQNVSMNRVDAPTIK
jgi:hypothetical protein